MTSSLVRAPGRSSSPHPEPFLDSLHGQPALSGGLPDRSENLAWSELASCDSLANTSSEGARTISKIGARFEDGVPKVRVRGAAVMQEPKRIQIEVGKNPGS